MFKRADLSLNVIIIAVIGLIVLIVVVAIFSGKMTIFQKGLKSCAGQGGKCSCFVAKSDGGLDRWDETSNPCPDNSRGCPENWGPLEGTDCNSDKKEGNDLCCIKVL